MCLSNNYNMKTIKQILFILTALIFPIAAAANEPQKGYRGFVDANTDLSFHQDGYGENATTVYYGISTSHGYQFNSHYFLGAGIMYERHHPVTHNSGHGFPVYIHARTDWNVGRLPLYGDLRIGGVVWGENRLFFSPTLGYRLNLGGKSNLNFGIGMNLRGYGWSDQKTLHPQLAVRVGIDF